jgi:hypothetical protein
MSGTSFHPRFWADTARQTTQHAELILGQQNIAEDIIKENWLEHIAYMQQDHANLILDRFGDRLKNGSEKDKSTLDAITFFANGEHVVVSQETAALQNFY